MKCGPDPELWLPVGGFEGFYEISGQGRVRSLRHVPAKILTPWLDKDGYPKIGLWNGKAQPNFRLHRLVALTFHGDKRNKLHNEVAHLDNDRTNARADNLKWVSKVENHSHRLLHGTHPSGERHPRAKLTEASVVAIRHARDPYGLLAARYGVSPYTISDIKRGRRWRHVG